MPYVDGKWLELPPVSECERRRLSRLPVLRCKMCGGYSGSLNLEGAGPIWTCVSCGTAELLDIWRRGEKGIIPLFPAGSRMLKEEEA